MPDDNKKVSNRSLKYVKQKIQKYAFIVYVDESFINQTIGGIPRKFRN